MQSNSTKRLLYLDWLRGVAALIMLQGHVFHSFLKTDLREGGAYVLSQFAGGMPPAVFLFLTGVTLAFLMHSSERKDMAPMARWGKAMRRSGYLFAVAYLFRLQLWLFGLPDSPWTDLLKVDILNAMGLAILVLSALALLPAAARVRAAALAGAGIAAVSPLVSQINWNGTPALVRDYLAPDYNHFSFFPWAAYVAFGVCAGTVLRLLKREHLDRAMQWTALAGMGIVVAAYYFSTIPYSLYAKSEFWLNSPAQVLIKQGVILMALPCAYLWTEYGAGGNWSWVRQLGTTSLLVYWVHIELVYGRWLWFLKERLDVAQTVLAAILVILGMILLSVARTHRDRWTPAVANFFRWTPGPTPDRVSGD
ncbi:MAG: heparan-alpha-glucosaminide N-acetyltransferase domain-containing protein [Bryobacteraceae bacterium]